MHKNMIRVGLTAIVTLVASLLPLATHAQSVDDWKWQATLYGWFPSIGGKTSFPPPSGNPTIDVDADMLLKKAIADPNPCATALASGAIP